MAAMAARMVELGFFGSSPMLARTIGSNLGFLGSRPRAWAIAGSSLGFFGSIPKAARSIGSREGVDDDDDFDLSPDLLVAG